MISGLWWRRSWRSSRRTSCHVPSYSSDRLDFLPPRPYSSRPSHSAPYEKYARETPTLRRVRFLITFPPRMASAGTANFTSPESSPNGQKAIERGSTSKRACQQPLLTHSLEQLDRTASVNCSTEEDSIDLKIPERTSSSTACGEADPEEGISVARPRISLRAHRMNYKPSLRYQGSK